MDKFSPHQEMFQLCRTLAIEVLGVDNVYDYIPGKETKYPFFFIGEQFGIDIPNKTYITPDITQTIHYYSNNIRTRGTSSKHINALITKVRASERTAHFFMQKPKISVSMMYDNSTATPLLHGVIEIKARLY